MSSKNQSIKKVKDKNMNVKFPEDDYRKLQDVAEHIGGMSLSTMIRTLVYNQLDKVEKTKDYKSFLNIE